MKYDAYRDLIKRLEAEAARDPKGYTLRVGAFGVLGYLYILAVFAAMLALLNFGPRLRYLAGSWLSIKLGLLLVPLVFFFLGVLFRRVAAPPGVPLTRERVPALFTLIDEVAKVLHAPRPHRVLITASYNCAMFQRPRLGVFGWPENILILGLPMLEALSRARFRAVLAHELGHLAAHHGTFGGRLHAVSDSWQLLLQRLSLRRSALLHVFEVFFRWFGPRFQAMGFVLGRRQEYFADHCSRLAAGLRATRGALVRIEVMGRHYRDAMEQTTQVRLRHQSSPPEDVVPVVARRMRDNPSLEDAQKWIDEALRAETGYEHTHPALRDRLVALEPGMTPFVSDALAEPGPSAAQQLLGDALEPITQEVSAAWVVEMAPAWKHRHEELAVAERTANAIEGGTAPDSASPDAAWTAVAARLELDGDQGARERVEAFLASHPDHAVAHYRLGQILLARNDGVGLEHLERTMRLDSDATLSSCGLAVGFLRAQGRGHQADEFTRRAWEFSELAQKAEQERRFLRKKDRLVPHGLPPAAIMKLRARFAHEHWMAAAYLVRKEVEWRADKPCYVLGITMHRAWYRLTDPMKERVKVMSLFRGDVLPAGTWVFVLEGNLRWVRNHVARVDRSLIWLRPKRRIKAAKGPAKAA